MPQDAETPLRVAVPLQVLKELACIPADGK